MNRIVSAEPLPGCRLKVAFNDGVSGIFAVEPEQRGGVFLKLLDAKIFNAVTVNPDFGCVEWPGGIDLCPDVMHQAIAGSGSEKGRPLAAALHEDAKPADKSSHKRKH
ncbi:MAG: DUF2442 domain-containing protein [Limisphaerales bacterium]